MVTHAVHHASVDPHPPLYRMDRGAYKRLVAAGALDETEVGLRGGLLVGRLSPRGGALHRLDTDTYNRMVDTGALEGERVELLEGLPIEVTPQGPGHADAIMRLTRHLATAADTDTWLRVQLPLEVAPSSELEPDLALVGSGETLTRHPRAALLVVEVAVTSHDRDRREKGALYARASIPAYWLVDVPGLSVEVRADPAERGYGRCETYGIGMSIPSPVGGVPDLDVAWLFDASD